MALSPVPDMSEAIVRLGRPALAWEVLRRDPVYREAFAAWSGDNVRFMTTGRAFTARWGLHFP